MKPQEKLVAFMRAKAECLGTIDLRLKELYFSKDDEEALRRISNEEARRVLSALRYFIFEEYEEGLSERTCPFCILSVIRRGCDPLDGVHEDTVDCKECAYAAHHGVCYNNGSDFATLIAMLHKNEAYADAILDNDFYVTLLEELG